MLYAYIRTFKIAHDTHSDPYHEIVHRDVYLDAVDALYLNATGNLVNDQLVGFRTERCLIDK